jgi:hypothetical protein
VFGAEVFMVSTSVWVVGCSTRSSGLLASLDATWGSVDGLFGICVWFRWLFERC